MSLPSSVIGAGIGDELTGDGVEKRGLPAPLEPTIGGKVPLSPNGVHLCSATFSLTVPGLKVYRCFQLKHGGHLLSAWARRRRNAALDRMAGAAMASATMMAEISFRHSEGTLARRASAMMKR